MDKKLHALQQNFEVAVQRADAEDIEFWFARDLQPHLGYARWENLLSFPRSRVGTHTELK